jgi:Transposase, Mutator family
VALTGWLGRWSGHPEGFNDVTQAANNEEKASGGGGELEVDLVDRLLSQADAEGRQLVGPGGLLTQLTQRVLERALDVEMADHLGYEAGDPAGHGSGNSRNGRTRKTVLTDIGPVPITVPRDRNGTFQPQAVPKRQRRLDGLNDAIVSLYARGMTVRDIRAHLGSRGSMRCHSSIRDDPRRLLAPPHGAMIIASVHSRHQPRSNLSGTLRPWVARDDELVSDEVLGLHRAWTTAMNLNIKELGMLTGGPGSGRAVPTSD